MKICCELEDVGILTPITQQQAWEITRQFLCLRMEQQSDGRLLVYKVVTLEIEGGCQWTPDAIARLAPVFKEVKRMGQWHIIIAEDCLRFLTTKGSVGFLSVENEEDPTYSQPLYWNEVKFQELWDDPLPEESVISDACGAYGTLGLLAGYFGESKIALVSLMASACCNSKLPFGALLDPQVRALNLRDAGADAATLGVITDLLTNNGGESSLEFLHLGENTSGDEALQVAQRIADLVRHTPHLKEFHCQRACSGYSGTKLVLSSLPKCVQVLDLSDASFSDETEESQDNLDIVFRPDTLEPSDALVNLLMDGEVSTLVVSDTNVDLGKVLRALASPSCRSKPTKVNVSSGSAVSFESLLTYLKTKPPLECLSMDYMDIGECVETDDWDDGDKKKLVCTVLRSLGALPLRLLSIQGWDLEGLGIDPTMASLLLSSEHLVAFNGMDNWSDDTDLVETFGNAFPQAKVLLLESGSNDTILDRYFVSFAGTATWAGKVIGSLPNCHVAGTEAPQPRLPDVLPPHATATVVAATRAFSLIFYCFKSGAGVPNLIEEWVGECAKGNFKEIPITLKALVLVHGELDKFKKVTRSIRSHFERIQGRGSNPPVDLTLKATVEALSATLFALIVTHDTLATYPEETNPIASGLVRRILEGVAAPTDPFDTVWDFGMAD